MAHSLVVLVEHAPRGRRRTRLSASGACATLAHGQPAMPQWKNHREGARELWSCGSLAHSLRRCPPATRDILRTAEYYLGTTEGIVKPALRRRLAQRPLPAMIPDLAQLRPLWRPPNHAAGPQGSGPGLRAARSPPSSTLAPPSAASCRPAIRSPSTDRRATCSRQGRLRRRRTHLVFTVCRGIAAPSEPRFRSRFRLSSRLER